MHSPFVFLVQLSTDRVGWCESSVDSLLLEESRGRLVKVPHKSSDSGMVSLGEKATRKSGVSMRVDGDFARQRSAAKMRMGKRSWDVALESWDLFIPI